MPVSEYTVNCKMRYHAGVIALALCVALATALPLQEPVSAAINDGPQPPQPSEVTTSPSSVCTLGEKKGTPANCRMYSECKDNAWVEKSCYWFWKFDSVSNKCMFWGATCTK